MDIEMNTRDNVTITIPHADTREGPLHEEGGHDDRRR
jgi:hypothetical protein